MAELQKTNGKKRSRDLVSTPYIYETDAISSSNNQAFNATIPNNIGNTNWSYNNTKNTLFNPPNAGYNQVYSISMPFSVSKIKLSFVTLASYSKYGWLNRNDRGMRMFFSSANYSQGSSVNMTVGQQIVLMKADSTSYYFEPVSHVFKLYQGYLSYGIDAVRSSNGNSSII